MKRFALIICVACGSKSPPPAQPVENTAPALPPSSTATGEIRVIQRGAPGGVIELQGDREPSMRAADQEMISVCGANKYTIIQEGEEAIQGSNGEMTGVAWRVHYRCFTNP